MSNDYPSIKRFEEYTPALTVQDVPSRGRVSRIMGNKVPRMYSFMSDLEKRYFAIAEYSATAIRRPEIGRVDLDRGCGMDQDRAGQQNDRLYRAVRRQLLSKRTDRVRAGRHRRGRTEAVQHGLRHQRPGRG